MKFLFTQQQLVVALILLAGCKKKSDLSRVENVFSTDDRSRVPSDSSGYKTIVKLVSSQCTGFWIGSTTVMTAAHCIENSDGGDFTSVSARVSDGRIISLRLIKKGPHSKTSGPVGDYAFLESQSYSSEKWLSPAFSEARVGMDLSLVAFHGDTQDELKMSSNCNVKSLLPNRLFLHDCDMTRGASGAPILSVIDNKWRVIGVQSSENRQNQKQSLKLENYSDLNSNIGVIPVL